MSVKLNKHETRDTDNVDLANSEVQNRDYMLAILTSILGIFTIIQAIGAFRSDLANRIVEEGFRYGAGELIQVLLMAVICFLTNEMRKSFNGKNGL